MPESHVIGKSLTKDRKYDAGFILTACAAGCALLLMSIFVWQNFPACYVDGTGLTGFKIASEYLISLLMLVTIGIIVHRRRVFDPTVWKFLVAAMIFLVAGELAFTSYVSVYGFANMVGHLAKLISAYFSPHFYTLLGYENGEFPATYAAWRKLVHPDHILPVEAELEHHITTDTSFAIDLRMKTKPGAWR